MKTKRIVSLLLAVLTIMGSMVITVGAADGEKTKYEYTSNTTNVTPTIDYLYGTTKGDENGAGRVAVNTAEKKLATMDLKLAKDGYLLYVDAYSGEVAVVCEATGESLFTNPYNIASSTTRPTSDKDAMSLRSPYMSQLVVYFQDLSTSTDVVYNSYEWCSSLGQIDVKNIKNGVRVEYAIGREEARMLVPGAVKKETFEAKILTPLAENVGGADGTYKYDKVRQWYRLYDPETMDIPANVLKKYPSLKTMALYVLDINITDPKKAILEGDIKTYCPDYSYEDLDADHMEAQYESEDKEPPLFKMALEYVLDEDGLSVRLPANGIRFNESLYQLDKIDVLPYMGAGSNTNPGYTFYPDGSGAIFDFETIKNLGMPVSVGSNIYGEDYAYHSITMKHEETIRYPVFGLVETETHVITSEDPTIPDKQVTKDRGYVAIVEEGDAMMRLEANHAGKTNIYNNVKMTVFPRPKDTYNIADAISVGSNSTWTVVSSRKYTGNYKIRYVMLTDPDVAAEKGIKDSYDTSYVGMAKAYREYLEGLGILQRLTAEDIREDIPLYIETFGAAMTTKRVLSVPVTTMAPLTSFENIKTMYNDLSAKGITNINFVLNGYTKGGMSTPSAPYNLKWEKAVGGENGFEDLVAYAKEKDFGIFPDVDFAFVSGDGLFDGVSLKKHAVKTIDNRYASKRVYSATKQTHISYYEMAISPAYFSRFYEKFTENYLKYDPMGISVSTLGAYLNSDFDEDEPYNRGDSKGFTVDAFEYLDSKYDKVMTSGGNAYSWKYVDYIRDIPLDSSRFKEATATVPFIGMVLHGYLQIAGTAINTEGNTDYALLKAIENGASLNFMLSYQNTDILKNNEQLSQYFSVRYDIWFNDTVSMYNELNAVLKGVQTSLIVDHQFIIGERVPDADELLEDGKAAVEEAIRKENELKDAAMKELAAKLLEARKSIYSETDLVNAAHSTTKSNIDKLIACAVADKLAAYLDRLAADALAKEIEDLKKAEPVDQATIDAKQAQLDALVAKELPKDAAAGLKDLQTAIDSVYYYADTVANEVYAAKAAIVKANKHLEYLKENGEYSETVLNDLAAMIKAASDSIVSLEANVTTAKDLATAAYDLVKDVAGIVVAPYEIPEQVEEAPETEGDGEAKPEEKPAEDEGYAYTKYTSDENKIVLVTYENGTSFVLNFNNYAITTVVNGVAYTVDGYSYVMFTK